MSRTNWLDKFWNTDGRPRPALLLWEGVRGGKVGCMVGAFDGPGLTIANSAPRSAVAMVGRTVGAGVSIAGTFPAGRAPVGEPLSAIANAAVVGTTISSFKRSCAEGNFSGV